MGWSAPTTEQGAEALTAILHRPERTLVALDFDGTLAPIVNDPEQAFAHPASVSALGRVAAHVGCVAVITGRPAVTAVRLGRFRDVAGLNTMIVLGQYGFERWDAATDEFVLPPEPEEVQAVARELPIILAELGLADARVEHKGRAIGVHTRELADPEEAFRRLQQPMRELADRSGLVVEPGRNVLEIRAPGMDKGAALRGLVEHTAPLQVIFAGDDLGDLPAFRTVAELRTKGLHGLLVCSASHEEDALAELADVVVDGPQGLAGWLDGLAEQLEPAGSR